MARRARRRKWALALLVLLAVALALGRARAGLLRAERRDRSVLVASAYLHGLLEPRIDAIRQGLLEIAGRHFLEAARGNPSWMRQNGPDLEALLRRPHWKATNFGGWRSHGPRLDRGEFYTEWEFSIATSDPHAVYEGGLVSSEPHGRLFPIAFTLVIRGALGSHARLPELLVCNHVSPPDAEAITFLSQELDALGLKYSIQTGVCSRH